MTRHVACRFPLSLCKGEGRVRVNGVSDSRHQTPHLNPLPFTKGRGDGRRVMFESRPGDNAWLAGFIKNLKYAFARRAPGLDKLIELMQPADRIVEKRRQH